MPYDTKHLPLAKQDGDENGEPLRSIVFRQQNAAATLQLSSPPLNRTSHELIVCRTSCCSPFLWRVAPIELRRLLLTALAKMRGETLIALGLLGLLRAEGNRINQVRERGTTGNVAICARALTSHPTARCWLAARVNLDATSKFRRDSSPLRSVKIPHWAWGHSRTNSSRRLFFRVSALERVCTRTRRRSIPKGLQRRLVELSFHRLIPRFVGEKSHSDGDVDPIWARSSSSYQDQCIPSQGGPDFLPLPLHP